MVMKLFGLLLPSVHAELVATPHGYRPSECVVEIPDDATFFESGKGLVIKHNDGKLQSVEVPESCHTDNVAMKMAGRRQLASTSNSSVRQWMDNAGYTYNAGYKSFSGNYNIPADPENDEGQILYYFIGLENTNDGPVNILQPVLGWQGGWTLASWACCPANISTTSRTITGLQAGQQVVGNMERVDASTWKIDSTINGQTTTLRPQVGPYNYVWADVTLEIYSISDCTQYSKGKVHFTDMVLTGSGGDVVHPSWTQPAGTECQGKVDILDEKSIDIYHNGGDGEFVQV